ncbi:penicillin acylase family protein [Antribacter soli]|nr:penicillin acylase family protein [Antribacter soli]
MSTTTPDQSTAPDEVTPPEPPAKHRSRLRRMVVGTAVVVVLVLVAGTTFGVVTGRRPLPQYDGELTLDGLSAEAHVFRDAQGVPQVYAETPEDLFRAQGYVQAQDRFFEMDYRRHVTAGRLSELVGDQEAAINADMVLRTFGWREVAEQELNLLAPETRSYLEAYADGVNAYLEGRHLGEIAVEYTVLGVNVNLDDPEPWEPVDSLAWLKAMAWDLRDNYDDELDRALAYSTLKDPALVDELFPAYAAAGNAPIVDPAELELAAPLEATQTSSGTTAELPPGDDAAFEDPHLAEALEAARQALAAVPVQIARGEGTGSNSWAIAGDLTESGEPLLANDPHLKLTSPGVWAQVGLHCTEVGEACPFDVAGFSFAGFPGVMIGHNADLAWGLTNMGADVTDFFIERVRDDNWLRDGTPGAEVWEPIETRTETIRVEGSSPIDFEVRSTAHGPIISSVMDETEMEAVRHAPTEYQTELGQYEISLAWTALEPGRTADAVFALNLAATPEDVQAAAAVFDVPAQNIVFATTDGHIGYQAPGSIPVRADFPATPRPDGTWPRPGWDARFDWTGYVDPSQMPRVLDPAEGFIVAANQAVLPSGTGPFLTNDWDYGYRSQRIRTLIQQQVDAGRKFSVDDMASIQTDADSRYAEMLVPALLDVDLPDGYQSDGQRLLEDWDGSMDADSAAAAYFAAVWRNLLKETFWDELPESMRPDGSSQWLTVVQGMLGNVSDPFWDDKSTVAVVESRDEILSRALVTARQDLTVELGKDAEDWTWGTLHQLQPPHPLGAGVPGALQQFLEPASRKVGGSSSVVNATSWDAGTGSFAVSSGPSMRMVVDLGHLDRSTWVTVSGVSAHPASSHFEDQLDAWVDGETFGWPFSPTAVEGTAEDELTLVP